MLPPAPAHLKPPEARTYNEYRRSMPWLTAADQDLVCAAARLAGRRRVDEQAVLVEILDALMPAQGTA